MTSKIAILGFAHPHVGMYCAQWRKMPPQTVQLVAGWDHDALRLAENAVRLGIAAETSSAALLQRADIDAVIIAAETSLHAELVEQAAAAGKAIILQKPLALTLDQADRIVAAVHKHSVPFSLAWQMRCDPQNLEMRRIVRDGTLGRIYMVRRRHGLPTQLWTGFEDSWHVKKELNRGMWADDAAHAIDFLYWLLGIPLTVSAEIATLRNPRVPDDNGIAIFRYADGTMAEVMSSFVCLAGENTTEIVGERGVAIQNYGDAISCSIQRPAEAVGLRWFIQEENRWFHGASPTPANHGLRISALAGPILDFLQGRRDPIATAEEGRDVLRMTLASYQAAQTGRRVDIADVVS